MDWRELWRLRLSEEAGTPPSAASPPTSESGESGDAADIDSAEYDAVRTRFFFVVARTRLDLFLTIRRQFRDDRTVFVMLDRREQDRRSKVSALDGPDRRQADRRRANDYWEDIGHHPAVLVPLTRLRQPSDPRPATDAVHPDKERLMERVLIDEARMLAWVQEGQHVFQHVLPAVIDERDALKTQLQAVTRRCEELQRENEGLRAETARTVADHRQLEQGHADIVNSVGQFLSQLTHVLEPMRVLADKLGQARAHHEGVDRAG
jgi:hypothetical protein